MNKSTTILKDQISNSPNLNNTSISENLTIEQLVQTCIDNESNNIGTSTREELVKRGKDNIQTRISIKKCCKSLISDLENLLNKASSTSSINKQIIKSLKGKFLSIVSILDRIQIEWQKHDLSLRD